MEKLGINNFARLGENVLGKTIGKATRSFCRSLRGTAFEYVCENIACTCPGEMDVGLPILAGEFLRRNLI